jgi:hypothetical protein
VSALPRGVHERWDGDGGVLAAPVALGEGPGLSAALRLCVGREVIGGDVRMAERGALERLPYRELVKLAQSAGITDVKLLMPANHQALITAVLTVQQKQADREKREKRFAVVRTLAVPGAAVVTAAVASTKDGKEALMAAWPSVALFCELVASIICRPLGTVPPACRYCAPVAFLACASGVLACCHECRRTLHHLARRAVAGMLLLAFFGWSPLNEGYNWQRWELRLPRAK